MSVKKDDNWRERGATADGCRVFVDNILTNAALLCVPPSMRILAIGSAVMHRPPQYFDGGAAYWPGRKDRAELVWDR
jgi:hypothetical protein